MNIAGVASNSQRPRNWARPLRRVCHAIDAAYEVDEVKAIHDQAKMYQACAHIAKNNDAEMRAYEIRMRTARKAGELLKVMEKAKPNPLP